MQVASPRVVTQPGPQVEHFIERRPGETGDVGKGLYEAFEIGDDRLDSGLLEHDFRQPDPVGGARPLPGQVVATMLIEPG